MLNFSNEMVKERTKNDPLTAPVSAIAVILSFRPRHFFEVIVGIQLWHSLSPTTTTTMIIDAKTIILTLIFVTIAFYCGLRFVRAFALSIAQENHDANVAMDQAEEEQRLKREKQADAAAATAYAKVEPLLTKEDAKQAEEQDGKTQPSTSNTTEVDTIWWVANHGDGRDDYNYWEGVNWFMLSMQVSRYPSTSASLYSLSNDLFFCCV